MKSQVFCRHKLSVIITLLLTVAGLGFTAPVTVSYGVFDVTFYNNGDTNGSYTGQGDWTSEQMADVADSIQTWQNKLANIPGRQIQMHAFWNELDVYSQYTLGSSGSARIANGTDIWNLGEYVWKEGLNPGYASTGFDTIIRYDITAAGYDWNFGADPPGAGQIDFRSVVTHEIGHSLGWSSSFRNSFDDWGWFSNSNGYYGLTDWDRNLVDSAGNRAQSGSSGTPGNFNQVDNPVYFDGANASGLYGGSVPIYAPEAYSSGSSLSHIDEAVLGNLLMSPQIALGENIRDISDLELAMMEDMDWTVVPEPATLYILAMGLAAIRKQQKKSR